MKELRRLALALAGVVAVIPRAAFAQSLASGGDPDISLARIVAALAICIGAAVGLALLISKRGLPISLPSPQGWVAKLRGHRRIAILDARRISPYADLCLVRSGDREYLLVCSQGDVRVLAETEVTTGEAHPISVAGAT